MAKKIKKIRLGEDEREVYDIESTHSINGYTNIQVETQEVTFANEPITTTDIEGVLAGTITSSTN